MSRYLTLLWSGLQSSLAHPKIIFVVVLAFVLPLLVAYVMYFSLATATDNQTSISRVRIGTVHDTTSALMLNSIKAADPVVLQGFLDDLMAANPDLEFMSIGRDNGETVLVLASSQPMLVGENDVKDDTYTRSLIQPGTPIAYEYFIQGKRYWETTSTFTDTTTGHQYYVVTTQNFTAFDSLIDEREWYAYALLFSVFLFLFLLAAWLIKGIDYQVRYEEAERRIEEQHQMSNMMAHELRAPLTAMRGYASMISESAPPESSTYQYATRIDESTQRLLHLVNDFLDVARIQSGQLKISKAECNVADIIRKLILDLTPLAGEKSLALEAKIEENTNTTIKTDGARLTQVLTNLTSNAIKYTKEGRVTLELHETKKFVEIRIKDTGAGISAEDQKRLFAPFFRVENADTNKIVGTGLGMWITQKLVDSLGGTIGVESIKDVGTNIVVTLPH